jgi:hypothetical protein
MIVRENRLHRSPIYQWTLFNEIERKKGNKMNRTLNTTRRAFFKKTLLVAGASFLCIPLQARNIETPEKPKTSCSTSCFGGCLTNCTTSCTGTCRTTCYKNETK